MKEVFTAQKISDKVYWVGAVDWNVRNFHGYLTGRGSTYNAFLVLDKKITLIDTVKAPFAEEMFSRIRSVIGEVDKIDYIVSNHSEPDHSGALPAAIEAIKPEKIFASAAGEKNLKAYSGTDLDITTVKTGESISIGDDTLTFVETKMLHWPDSMVSYLAGEKMLFTQDAFGMHLAGSSLYADEYPRHILEYEAKKYFANILLHLSGKVIALLDSLPGLDLDIQMILPDHGPLWRTPEDIAWILGKYREFAEQKNTRGALVFYATMWGSTAKMANALADGLREGGVQVECASLDVNDRSDIMTKVMDAAIVAAGSPTMNNQLFPSVADVLTYLSGLKPQNKIGYAFGSYGWSGEAVKKIADSMFAMNMALPVEPCKVKYRPTEADLKKLHDDGLALAEQLKKG